MTFKKGWNDFLRNPWVNEYVIVGVSSPEL